MPVQINFEAIVEFTESASPDQLELLRELAESIQIAYTQEATRRAGRDPLLERFAERERDEKAEGSSVSDLDFVERFAEREFRSQPKAEAEAPFDELRAFAEKELAQKSEIVDDGSDLFLPFLTTSPDDHRPRKTESLHSQVEQLTEELAVAEKRIRELESENEKLRSRESITSTVGETREDAIKLLAVDLSSIPLFPGGRGHDPWIFFKENYGPMLRHFGAEKDTVALATIRDHDPKLITALGVRISRERKFEEKTAGGVTTPRLSEIVPDRSEVVDRHFRLMMSMTLEEILKHPELLPSLIARVQGVVYRDRSDRVR